MIDQKILLFAGGVGGAKLADGLAQIVPPEQLTIVVNTGDDFSHLGLYICPDLDTVLYNLAHCHNPDTGWGRKDESWQMMAELKQLSGPDWFQLGDRDLAVHLLRTHWKSEGMSLTAITQRLAKNLNVHHPLLPMSDALQPTLIETEEGVLSFQDWFVRRRWQPAVKQVILPEEARATAAVCQAIEKADWIFFAPSNPFVSIDPILNCYPIRPMLEDLPKTVIAVSPIIGNQAVKGPAAKLMKEFNMPTTAAAIANYYLPILDGFLYDEVDAGSVTIPDLATKSVPTMMVTPMDRHDVAQQLLDFARTLS